MLEEKDIEMFKSLLKEQTNEVLDEIGRTQIYLEDKIEQLRKSTEELHQYYKVAKIEADNTTLLLKVIEDLTKRVEDLENRIA